MPRFDAGSFADSSIVDRIDTGVDVHADNTTHVSPPNTDRKSRLTRVAVVEGPQCHDIVRAASKICAAEREASTCEWAYMRAVTEASA